MKDLKTHSCDYIQDLRWNCINWIGSKLVGIWYNICKVMWHNLGHRVLVSEPHYFAVVCTSIISIS